MDTLLQDLRRALRLFRDQPGFTATALLALTVGVGVNSGVFSLVNAVLLKPLPYPEPDRLVALLHGDNGAATKIVASPAHFTHWQAQSDIFEDVAAWRTVSFDYSAGDTPASVTAGTVSDAYFRALGAQFTAGRAPTADEYVSGAAKTVVLSHAFWLRRLGGDRAAIGSTLSLNGAPHTIVGVTAAGFDVGGIDARGFGVPEVWVPLEIDADATDFSVTLDVFARLRDGVSLAAAQQRLAASIVAYRERYPEDTGDWQFVALGMHEAVVGESRPMLLVLAGAVALVLLVACANVANLLLVRAVGRSREVAIRATLGAGRARIVRQLVTESLVLTLTGGALGVAAALAGLRWLLASGLLELPRLTDASALLALDWRVLAFTTLVSIVTGIVFGLLPALAAARTDLCSVIKDSSRAAGGRLQTKTQSILVTVEVALAVVLVIGAGLLIRTSLAIGAVDLGFALDGVLTLRGSAADAARPTSAVVATNERALARLLTIPGVEAAAASLGAPLNDNLFAPFDIVGRQNAGASTGAAIAVPTSTGYFETLGIPLLRGRLLASTDDRSAPPVAVINSAMADRYWADGRDPFDEQLRLGGTVIPEAAAEPARQIVGIVRNVRQKGLFAETEPTMYLPHAQLSDDLGRAATLPTAWLVRTSVPPQSVSAAVQQALREETGQPVANVELLESRWLESIASQRLNSWLLTLFGATAALLGAIGVYGLVAHTVECRQHELGIRLALGARPGTLRNMVIREAMLRVVAGVGLGIVAAYSLANVLAALLYGVEPHDVTVFVAVPLALTAVGLAAVSLPALRATGVDPTSALRNA